MRGVSAEPQGETWRKTLCTSSIYTLPARGFERKPRRDAGRCPGDRASPPACSIYALPREDRPSSHRRVRTYTEAICGWFADATPDSTAPGCTGGT